MESIKSIKIHIMGHMGAHRSEQSGSLVRFALPSALLATTLLSSVDPLTTRTALLGACVLGGSVDTLFSSQNAKMRLRGLAAGGATALAITSFLSLLNFKGLSQVQEIYLQTPGNYMLAAGKYLQAWAPTFLSGIGAETAYKTGMLGIACAATATAVCFGRLELYTARNGCPSDRTAALYHFVAPLTAGLIYAWGFDSATLAVPLSLLPLIQAYIVPPIYVSGSLLMAGLNGSLALFSGGNVALLCLSLTRAWSAPDWLNRGMHIASGLGTALMLFSTLKQFSKFTHSY